MAQLLGNRIDNLGVFNAGEFQHTDAKAMLDSLAKWTSVVALVRAPAARVHRDIVQGMV